MTSAGAILLIEDNADDAFLIERRLRKHQIPGDLTVVSSGSEARNHLGQLSNDQIPKIILLSMDLGSDNAMDLLKALRADSRFHACLIVAIGDSERPQDVQAAYDLGANAWFTRRIGFDQLAETIRNLEFIDDLT